MVATLATLAACAAAALLGCSRESPPADAPAQASERANLVIIVLDTLRADRLGSYDYPKSTSPEIDALAERGVRFERVIAQSSWTRPSIASMLTSLYPRTVGINKEFDEILADDFVTLAEVLQDSGYSTLAATANPNINTSFNFQQGFDTYLDSDVVFSWMPAAAEERSSTDAPLQSAHDIFAELLTRLRRGGDPPFHVMATVMDIHEAFDDRVDLTQYADLFQPMATARYLQAIRMVSNEVGEFVHELSALPGWENTLFVITSDHGQGLHSHPGVADSFDHGWHLYESHVAVPLILYSPGDDLPRGHVVTEQVRLLDVMPTLLDLLGVDGPPGMDGVSLRPLIEGGTRPPGLPAHFVVETRFRDAEKVGVYGGAWNYFEHRVPRAGTDPRELQRARAEERGAASNQLATEAEEAARLRAILQAWERAHPKAAPTRRDVPLSPSVERQLRSLGYLE